MSKKDKVEQFFDAVFKEVEEFASGKFFEVKPEVTTTNIETDTTERERPENTFKPVTSPSKGKAARRSESIESGNDAGRMEKSVAPTEESDDDAVKSDNDKK
jgi:hypothetical protein